MYYFKKEDFISLIYIDFIEAINKRIEAAAGDRLENIFQMHLIRTRIFYNIIFSADEYKNLYKEILFEDLLPFDSPAHAFVRKPLVRLIEDFNVDVPEEIFELALEAEFGGRMRLLKMKYDNLNPKRAASFIYFISTLSARLIEIPQKTINENTVSAEQLLGTIEYSDIPFVDLSDEENQ